MEASITDKAEELEIGKPTKVGFCFFFTLFFSPNAKQFFLLRQIKGNPSLEPRCLEGAAETPLLQ